MPVVLEARNLVKHYGHVTALDGTDFELHRGEILAVIGDNGAGKSTLIKALSGALIPDSGEVRLDGQVVLFRNPIDARRAGIETVYQDLAVAPAMSIAENLFLGREPRRSGFAGSVFRMLDKKRMLVESAWSYRHQPRVGAAKLARVVAAPPAVRDIAWKAQVRLTARYRALKRAGKLDVVAITAVARELAGFVWAVARATSPPSVASAG